MKKFILVICLYVTNVFQSPAQGISLLDKNETFIASEQDMIVMDKYTFAKYHYTLEQYDSLKQEALNYDATVKWMDSLSKEIENGYKQLLASKDKQIQDYNLSFSSLKVTLQQNIEEQKKMQIAYLNLQEKQNRVKKWRTIFLGTSAVLAGIIVLLVR